MQKVTQCFILFARNYYVFAPQGFVTKCFLIFIIDEVKNFAANNLFFKLLELLMYWDPCNVGGIHILESSEFLKRQKVSVVCSSIGIVESRDKGCVLDLKLLFIIVDCFLGRFPPKCFTVKLVCFIGFPKLSYLVLFTISLCMILMFVCFNKIYS